ncbi:hypothetical protein AGENTSMITH_4 [Bacillus phage vB_BspM_AgentSmith]|nr:hypothetical protein AGENTSMITH_4 [Bacillus phage vB_BspM_AgentSmith]
MRRMGFKEESIQKVTGNGNFAMAYDKAMNVQRTYLTMLFHGLFMNSTKESAVPKQIRMALNIANGSEGWLDDVKLVILPFLKENEEYFF